MEVEIMAKRTKMTKKELMDLLSYISLYAIGKDKEDVDELITEEQADKLMKSIIQAFDQDEKKAINFLRNRIKQLVEKLDKHQSS
jgi:hypothetical protein